MIRIRIPLLFLTFCIALLGFIPLFPYIEPAPRFLFLAAFAAGILADYRNRYPAASITTLVSILFFAFYMVQFSRDNVLSPAANAIILLLGVRLISEKSGRNHLQVFVLALIALAASSLYSLDAVFLVYLLVQLVLITVSMVLLTFHGKDPQMNISRPGMKKILTSSLLMSLAIIPLTVFFFLILPRTQYPLWHLVQKPSAKVTGFSDKIEPGTASTAAAKIVAFRAESSRVEQSQLYWRGIVLNQIAGNTWSRIEPPAGEVSRVKAGPTIRQTIYPEPSQNRYLITLNIPRQLSGTRAIASRDLVFYKSYQSQRRISYSVESIMGDRIGVVGGIHHKFYLKLPTGISPRMKNLASDLRRQSRDHHQLLSRLEDFYRGKSFIYLTSDLPTGSSSIDTFLFDKRSGNCEFFAVSAATLLRLAKVPTRLVGGYLGGEYNPIGRYYTVTEDMAHVWMEVYLAGEGWVTVDPTRWAVNTVRSSDAGRQGMMRQLQAYLDLFGYYWNRAVITYDLESQISLAGAASRNLKQLKIADLKIFVVLLVVVAAVVFARLISTKRVKTREERLLSDFLRIVGKQYPLTKEPGTFGLYELADETGDPWVKHFASIYGEAVYHEQPLTVQQIKQLEHILSLLEKDRQG
ncbi:transglutaminase TgpA family protein [Geotalea toluenoxydans]|uniref:transglutaminase family protein n=1 Tax=Geotalea toluenoxydans TaxID=421624 RepID=UPI0006D11483|nr:DUF3488 and transglutaminase-like domain-containing protein [Geotalea toluenoxydans]